MSIRARRGAFALAIIMLLSSVLLSSAMARAGVPDEVGPGHVDAPMIHGGSPVGVCGWPTVVTVVGGGRFCSGTLVHPELVLYAGHCGGGDKALRLGESSQTGRNLDAQPCVALSDDDGAIEEGRDWAFCVLNQPVTDLPITPVMYGCEMNDLAAGDEVAIAGFGGDTPEGGWGIKRWAITKLTELSIEENLGRLGGAELPSVCPGDSGGPAFRRGSDGVWRAWGIASTVKGGCGGPGTYSLMAGAVPWIEDTSGIDITPCHDQEGRWNPSPACAGFFTSGADSFGDWYDGCEGTPSSSPSQTCGPPWGAPQEFNPPDVVVVSPESPAVYSAVPAEVSFEVDASDDSGAVTVWLRVDDEDRRDDQDSVPPYRIEGVAFAEGSYRVAAVAEDFWGNRMVSEVVLVDVGVGEGEGGCGVTPRPRPPPWVLLVCTLWLSRRRGRPRSAR